MYCYIYGQVWWLTALIHTPKHRWVIGQCRLWVCKGNEVHAILDTDITWTGLSPLTSALTSGGIWRALRSLESSPLGSSPGMRCPIEWPELQKYSIYPSVLVSNLHVPCSNMGVVNQHWRHGLFRLTNGSGCWDTECSAPWVPVLRGWGSHRLHSFLSFFLTPPGLCLCLIT